MKRLASILLVAILIVTSFSVVAFAVEIASGASGTAEVRVKNSNGMNTVSVTATVNSALVVTGASASNGGTYYIAGNTVIASWSDSANFTERTLRISVSVPEGTAPGSYNGTASVTGATVLVPGENGEQGTVEYTTATASSPNVTVVCEHDYKGVEKTPATCGADGVMVYTCSKCGHSYEAAIPATGAHTWGAWTQTEAPSCTKEGSRERVCSVCNAVETQPIAKLPHDHKTLKYDKNGHWHECDCGDKTPVEAHDLKIDKNDTHHWEICSVCGYKTAEVEHNLEWKYNNDQHWKICEDCGYMTAPEDHDHDANGKCECGHTKSTGGGGGTGNDPMPDMGDATPYGTYNMMVAAVVITLFGTVALVEKRKNAK